MYHVSEVTNRHSGNYAAVDDISASSVTQAPAKSTKQTQMMHLIQWRLIVPGMSCGYG